MPSPGDQRHIEWITLGDGSIVHFDDPRAKLGYDHEQVLGKSIFALVGHEDVSVLQGIFAVARQVHDTDVAMRVRFTGAGTQPLFTLLLNRPRWAHCVHAGSCACLHRRPRLRQVQPV